jgi:hypothetical protein
VMFSTTAVAAASLLILTLGHGGTDERREPLICTHAPP